MRSAVRLVGIANVVDRERCRATGTRRELRAATCGAGSSMGGGTPGRVQTRFAGLRRRLDGNRRDARVTRLRARRSPTRSSSSCAVTCWTASCASSAATKDDSRRGDGRSRGLERAGGSRFYNGSIAARPLPRPRRGRSRTSFEAGPAAAASRNDEQRGRCTSSRTSRVRGAGALLAAQFTANTMAMVLEFLGPSVLQVLNDVSRDASGEDRGPHTRRGKDRDAPRAATDVRPSHVDHGATHWENAACRSPRRPAARRTVSCNLLAIRARARYIPPRGSRTSTGSPKRTPIVADIKPGADASVATDLHAAGGRRARSAREALEGPDSLHGDSPNVDGRSLAQGREQRSSRRRASRSSSRSTSR